MTVPERMRFIDMTGTGGPEVLTLAEGPVPQPGAGRGADPGRRRRR